MPGTPWYIRTAAALALLGGCGYLPVGGKDGPGGGDDGGGPVQPRFASLFGDYLGRCADCHAPNAPGRTTDIEMTLDFSSASRAHATITTGTASGLKGNVAACNGVPFVNADPAKSLLLAVLDQPTRTTFDLPSAPGCDASAITDETVKVGSAPSSAFVVALKQWLQDGAPNN